MNSQLHTISNQQELRNLNYYVGPIIKRIEHISRFFGQELFKIDINKLQESIVILPPEQMPHNVLGAYSPDLNLLFFNLEIFDREDSYLDHVIIHELIHAGYFTKGNRILDEALTDMLAEMITSKIHNGDIGFSSGYSEIVQALRSILDNIDDSDRDFLKLFLDNIYKDEESQLDFILASIGAPELFKTKNTEINLEMLTVNVIQKRMLENWKDILDLFPRLKEKLNLSGNFIEKRAKQIYSIIAKKIFEQKGILLDIISFSIKNYPFTELGNNKSISFILAASGFNYLVEYARVLNPNPLEQLISYYNINIILNGRNTFSEN